MTEEKKEELDVERIGEATKHVVRRFVQNAFRALSDDATSTKIELSEEIEWNRSGDGLFRQSMRRRRVPSLVLREDWLRTVPEYDACELQMRLDGIVGKQLDCMVGTALASARIEAKNILLRLVLGMIESDGRAVFCNERFESEWQNLDRFFCANSLACKTVAPIPHLELPTYPLALNKEIALDRLTDEEVTRCCEIGMIRPLSFRYPWINGKLGVGIRRIVSLPKLIKRDVDPIQQPGQLSETSGDGRFGSRPVFRDDLVVDDVLSALRLFKQTHIRCLGFAKLSDTPMLGRAMSSRTIGNGSYGGELSLSEIEISAFLDLWHRLEEGSEDFEFSIHRFNLAFERGQLSDRIVDLVIAAEALFLRDMPDKYRGELRYRFALRCAKFINHSTFGENEIFRLMREAYDTRSTFVHGGKTGIARLPDNKTVDLRVFVDIVEELVRLAIRKALLMKEDRVKLRQSEYWDSLVLRHS